MELLHKIRTVLGLSDAFADSKRLRAKLTKLVDRAADDGTAVDFGYRASFSGAEEGPFTLTVRREDDDETILNLERAPRGEKILHIDGSLAERIAAQSVGLEFSARNKRA